MADRKSEQIGFKKSSSGLICKTVLKSDPLYRSAFASWSHACNNLQDFFTWHFVYILTVF